MMIISSVARLSHLLSSSTPAAIGSDATTAVTTPSSAPASLGVADDGADVVTPRLASHFEPMET